MRTWVAFAYCGLPAVFAGSIAKFLEPISEYDGVEYTHGDCVRAAMANRTAFVPYSAVFRFDLDMELVQRYHRKISKKMIKYNKLQVDQMTESLFVLSFVRYGKRDVCLALGNVFTWTFMKFKLHPWHEISSADIGMCMPHICGHPLVQINEQYTPLYF